MAEQIDLGLPEGSPEEDEIEAGARALSEAIDRGVSELWNRFGDVILAALEPAARFMLEVYSRFLRSAPGCAPLQARLVLKALEQAVENAYYCVIGRPDMVIASCDLSPGEAKELFWWAVSRCGEVPHAPKPDLEVVDAAATGLHSLYSDRIHGAVRGLGQLQEAVLWIARDIKEVGLCWHFLVTSAISSVRGAVALEAEMALRDRGERRRTGAQGRGTAPHGS